MFFVSYELPSKVNITLNDSSQNLRDCYSVEKDLNFSVDNREKQILYSLGPKQQETKLDVIDFNKYNMPPIRQKCCNSQLIQSVGNDFCKEGTNTMIQQIPSSPHPPNFRPAYGGNMKHYRWNTNRNQRSNSLLNGGVNINGESVFDSDSQQSKFPVSGVTKSSPEIAQNSSDLVEGILNGDFNKGVKRVHEVSANGSATTTFHQYNNNNNGYNRNSQTNGYNPLRRSQGPHQGYQYNNKRRYPDLFRSPPPNHGSPIRGRRILPLPTPLPSNLVVRSIDRYLSRIHMMESTRPPKELTTGCEWDNLSRSMWYKFISNQQTKELFQRKMNVWNCLNCTITMSYPGCLLYVVGSTMTWFASTVSDIDMCLMVHAGELDQRNKAVEYLSAMLQLFRHCDYVEKPVLIHAKVPILKFREKNNRLDVDLNCNNAVGIRNTHLLNCYAQLDWRVRPLVLVIKLWAQFHEINDAKNRTISSYSLALMVIHFLQCGVQPAVLPCLHELYPLKFSVHSNITEIDLQEVISTSFVSENKQSLGELLLNFFHYYTAFSFSEYALSVRLARKIPIEECKRDRSLKNDAKQWKYLCIEEPFEHTNTARSVYDADVFEHICEVFRSTYEALKNTRSLEAIFLDK